MNLEGTIISFLGDSITESFGPRIRYDTRIERSAKLKKACNYGICGTRMAHQFQPSPNPRHDLCMCARIYDMEKSSDIIVVYGGTNDYGHGDAPFGTMEDETFTTFCGAVDFMMRTLPTLYPDAVIVFLTPSRREGDLKIRSLSNPTAKPLLDYVNVILEKGKQYDIPVLDLYHNLGINPNIPEERDAYTLDGLHFNDPGYEKLANCIMDFLRAL